MMNDSTPFMAPGVPDSHPKSLMRKEKKKTSEPYQEHIPSLPPENFRFVLRNIGTNLAWPSLDSSLVVAAIVDP